MARLTNRRVRRLARRDDIPGLLEALRYREPVPIGPGEAADAGTDVRLAALGALAEKEGEATTDGLATALADPSAAVRATALELLTGRHDDRATPALAAGLAQPEVPDDLHAEGIGVLGERNARVGLAAYAATVIEAGSGSLPAREVTALHSLAEAAKEEGDVEAVVADLLRSTATDNGERLEEVIAAIGDRSVDALLDALASSAARANAARALGRLHDRRALEPLLSHRNDDDPVVRREVVRALGSIKDPGAIGILLLAAQDEDYPVRKEALEALDGFGTVAVAASLWATGPSRPPAISGLEAGQGASGLPPPTGPPWSLERGDGQAAAQDAGPAAPASRPPTILTSTRMRLRRYLNERLGP